MNYLSTTTWYAKMLLKSKLHLLLLYFHTFMPNFNIK